MPCGCGPTDSGAGLLRGHRRRLVLAAGIGSQAQIRLEDDRRGCLARWLVPPFPLPRHHCLLELAQHLPEELLQALEADPAQHRWLDRGADLRRQCRGGVILLPADERGVHTAQAGQRSSSVGAKGAGLGARLLEHGGSVAGGHLWAQETQYNDETEEQEGDT
jgi:hypothetical protein